MCEGVSLNYIFNLQRLRLSYKLNVIATIFLSSIKVISQIVVVNLLNRYVCLMFMTCVTRFFRVFENRSVKWLSGGEGRKLEVFWEVWRCAAGPAELG